MSGMAPNAKITFFDIGVTNRDYLKVPVLSDIFDSAYETGARVHTNSWVSSLRNLSRNLLSYCSLVIHNLFLINNLFSLQG